MVFTLCLILILDPFDLIWLNRSWGYILVMIFAHILTLNDFDLDLTYWPWPLITKIMPEMGFPAPKLHWRTQRGGQGGQDPPPPLRFLGKSFCTWKINLYLLRNKVSKFVWLDLSPEDDQNRGEDIKISKNLLGETPFDKTTNHNTMDFIIW